MKCTILLFLSPLALAIAIPESAAGAPQACGRGTNYGICSTKTFCWNEGGFFVDRDCPSNKALGVGCCYDIPAKE